MSALADRLRGMFDMGVKSEDTFNHLTPAGFRLLRQAHDAASSAQALRDELARHAAERDEFLAEIGGCGNSGCIIVKPKGMHTNGGCGCARNWMKMQKLAYAHNRFADAVRKLVAGEVA